MWTSNFWMMSPWSKFWDCRLNTKLKQKECRIKNFKSAPIYCD